MGLLDKVNAGAERAAMEAWKAFDKGKAKASELQLEMRMDAAAKKLGYLVLDEHRGRATEEKLRQKFLDDLTRLEDEMAKLRAETAAKVAARGTAATSQPAGGQSVAGEPAESQSAEGQPSPDIADVAESWPEEGPAKGGTEC
ncbi:MAG TPA: hypothetical protein VIL51_05735 [Thermoleophilia bacterium]